MPSIPYQDRGRGGGDLSQGSEKTVLGFAPHAKGRFMSNLFA
jgi:hypothetical protein